MKTFPLLAAVAGLTVALSGCSGLWSSQTESNIATEPESVARAQSEAEAMGEAYVRDDSALFVVSNRGGAAVRLDESSAQVLYNDHHTGLYRQPIRKTVSAGSGVKEKAKAKNARPQSARGAGKRDRSIYSGKSAVKNDRSIYSKPAKKPARKIRKAVKKTNGCNCKCDCDSNKTCSDAAPKSVSRSNVIRETVNQDGKIFCPWFADSKPLTANADMTMAMQAAQTINAIDSH